MIKAMSRVLLSAALLMFLSGVGLAQQAKPEQPSKPEQMKPGEMKHEEMKPGQMQPDHPQPGQVKPDHPQPVPPKPDHPKHEHPK